MSPVQTCKKAWKRNVMHPELMSCLLRATFTVRISSSCQQISAFHARSSIYFAFFLHFLFFPFFALFFPSSCRFNCPGAFFSIKPPSFPSYFLVSLSRFFLCFRFLMVDYSMVRLDCPSISFFFARLSSLLGVVGRQCLEVGLFVGRNCSFRFVLRFLFPLVHHFVWFS